MSQSSQLMRPHQGRISGARRIRVQQSIPNSGGTPRAFLGAGRLSETDPAPPVAPPLRDSAAIRSSCKCCISGMCRAGSSHWRASRCRQLIMNRDAIGRRAVRGGLRGGPHRDRLTRADTADTRSDTAAVTRALTRPR